MRILLAVVPVLALAGCVVVPPPRQITFRPSLVPPTFNGQAGAISGERQRVDFIASINPDCTPVGERIDLVTRPEHGGVEFVSGQEFAAFPPGNPRSRCNDRRVPGTLVYYTSELGFRGVDSFTQTVLSTSGQQRTTKIAVSVR